MVVDSSAIVAVLLEEPDAVHFVNALANSNGSCISAVNVHETAIVLRRDSGASAIDLTWQFLARYGIDIVPFDEPQARAAVAAYDRYGKGIHSKAKLNLADCAAYALAKSLDAPLLFKGLDSLRRTFGQRFKSKARAARSLPTPWSRAWCLAPSASPGLIDCGRVVSAEAMIE